MTPSQQSANDRAEIKIRLIDNGYLVGSGSRWLAFKSWEEASRHISSQVMQLMSKRAP